MGGSVRRWDLTERERRPLTERNVLRLWARESLAERRRRRRSHYAQLVIAGPAYFGIVALFFWNGIASGNAADWQLGAWVDGRQIGGPLWFHLLGAFGLGAVLLVGGILGVRGEIVERPPSEARIRAAARDEPVDGTDEPLSPIHA